MQKLWFSIFDFSFNYRGVESSFINPDPFNWAAEIENNYSVIKDELSRFLEKNDLESYFNSDMVSQKNSWRTIALKTWSIELYKNQAFFPRTTALIIKYPQIVSASFNLLKSKARILPHCGDTNGIYRCHLGLDIPEGLPNCGFRVRDEKKAWENGKMLIFMDAYDHEAWNDSSKDRYIFLIDVLRDEFSAKKSTICSTVLTSLFLQKRVQKLPFIKKYNAGLTKLITYTLRPFALFAAYFCNKFKIY